jgi:hypothetical protein
MKNRRNYYRLLQVQPDAPVEVIRAAYRAMMVKLKYHPDLGGSTKEASDLNEAYAVLSDPKRRVAYDRNLYLQYAKRPDETNKTPLITLFCPVCKRPLARKPQPGDRCASCHSPLQSERSAKHRKAYERAVNRFRRSDTITYCTSWPDKAQQGTMIDFSPKGMRFYCSEKIAPRTVLKIRSRLCDASAIVTNSGAEVIEGRKLYVIGVSFLAVNFAGPTGSILSTSA